MTGMEKGRTAEASSALIERETIVREGRRNATRRTVVVCLTVAVVVLAGLDFASDVLVAKHVFTKDTGKGWDITGGVVFIAWGIACFFAFVLGDHGDPIDIG